ncbi:cobalt ECF transporter T component CbiQ [Candidatus Latescibacterota bacterium]
MHHLHIDRFAGLTSPVHRIDPRVKLLTTLVFIIMVVLTPNGYFLSYGIYFAAVLTALFFSNVPAGYIFKRSLTIIPFAFAISFFVPFITPGPVIWDISIGSFDIAVTSTGLLKFGSLCSRAFISFFAVITLVSSTRFGDLMWAAGRLGLPAKLSIIVSFMYRYLFIIVDEVSHMILARDLRSQIKRKNLFLTASGGIIGALLVRSFEHAEKLYYSMLLRGYTGFPVTLNSRHIKSYDIILSLLFIGLTAAGMLTGRFFYA